MGSLLAQPGSVDGGFVLSGVPDQPVYAVATQPDGKLVVGGEFQRVGTVSRVRLARLQADGSLDGTFLMPDGPNGAVRGLAVQADGRILVGGDFGAYRGQTQRYFLRLRADGSLDTDFALGDGPNGPVHAVALQADNRILVGGGFGAFAGQPRTYLARLQADGRLDPTFAPVVDGFVRVVAVGGDGRIWVGGDFSNVGGRYRRAVARLLPGGALDETFDPAAGPNGSVYALQVVPDGRLWIAGTFSEVNGWGSTYVSLLGATGLPEPSFRASLNNVVYAMIRPSDGRILIGGEFTQAGGQPASRVARLRSDGTPDPSFDVGVGADATVWSLGTMSGEKLVVGGAFTGFGGDSGRGRLVRLETVRAALGGEVEFASANFRASEAQTSVEIEVRRSGTTSQAVTVDYATRNGTANGGDYTGQAGKLAFAAGETRKTFTIPIRQDTTVEDDETVLLSLANPTGGAELGALATATLVLVNDDSSTVAGGLDAGFLGQADGPVHALAIQPDGKIVVGGDFSVVASASRRRIARLNTDGTVDPGFLPSAWLNGRVLTLAVQADGRILAGGDFTQVNGVPRNRLVRFLPDGGLDPTFDPGVGPNSSVTSLLIQPNGDLLVGGAFSAYDRENVGYLIRLFPDGSRDPDFETGLNGAVWTLAWVGEDRVMAGGDFTTAEGRFAPRVARFTLEGRLDPTFDPGSGPNSSVRALGVDSRGGFVLGGGFGEVNGLSRRYLGRLEAGGLPDVDHEADLNNWVHTTAQSPSGAVLIGGDFTTAAGQPANRLLRIREDGSADPGFTVSGEVDNSVYCLAVASDGKILVGGAFTRFGGLPRARLVRVEGVTRAPGGEIEFATLSQSVGESQGSLTVEVQRRGATTQAATVDYLTSNGTANAGDYTTASGKISFAAGESRKSIVISVRSDSLIEDQETFLVSLSNPSGGAVLGARRSTTVTILDDDLGMTVGGVDGGFGAAVFGEVYDTAVQPDGRVVVVGNFSRLRDAARLRIARLEPDGRIDPGFLPGAWLDGPAHTVTLMSDGRILVGGSFSVANGSPRSRLARFNTDGTLDPTFDPGPGPNSTVYALWVQPDGDILVGGQFSAYQGQPRPYLVRVYGDGNLDIGWQSQANSTVWCLSPASSGTWLAGGDFTSMAGRPRNRVARFLANGQLDLTFDPAGGPNATVRALAAEPGGRVVLGGQFSQVHGLARRYLARLEVDGLPDATFLAEPNSSVYSLAVQPDGRTIAGGEFTMMGQTPANRIARLLADGGVDPSFDPGLGANAAVYTVGLQPDGGVLVGGVFTEFNGMNRARIVRLQGLSLAAGGQIEFGRGLYHATESQGSVAVLVRRLGTSSEAVTVDYLTRNGTANAGDYASQSGTLVFGAGETSKTLLIQIRPDTLVESQETFLVVLQNPGAGAELGGERSATVVIEDDDNSSTPGAIDNEWAGSASARVEALVALPDGRVLVAGAFTLLNGQPRTQVGRWNPDGTLDASFSSLAWVNGAVHAAVVLDDGRVVVGGDFTVANGQTRNRVAAFRPDGTLDEGFDPGAGPNGSVYALHPVPGGGVLVGGGFSQVNGEAWPYLVRLYSDGNLDASFRPQADAAVWVMEGDSEGGTWIGGDFTHLAGQARVRLARLSAAGELDPGFDPGAGPNSSVRCLLPDGPSGVFAGGVFSSVDGVSRPFLARFTRAGQLDSGFIPELNGAVLSLAAGPGSTVVAAGEFTRAAGRDAGRVVRLQGDGSPDPAFDVGGGANAGVWVVEALPGGHLLVGGDFTIFAGLPRDHVVRLFGVDPSLSEPFGFTSVAREAAGIRLLGSGPAGRTYVLEAATDLGAWAPVATNPPGAAGFQFLDPQGSAAHRFYRVRSP